MTNYNQRHETIDIRAGMSAILVENHFGIINKITIDRLAKEPVACVVAGPSSRGVQRITTTAPLEACKVRGFKI